MIDFNGIPLDISPKINIDPFNVGLERKLKKIDDHRKKIIHEVYAKWFKTNNSDISNNGIYHNIAV